MPYRAEKPPLPETPEQLRARIPGWGADLDPADRPSFLRERTDLPTGAHWDVPERQPEPYPRERSIEHTQLPPVFGTAQPLHGPAGAIRRYAYDRFSEGRAAHWLLLIAGDRVDVAESRLRALGQGRPDNPIGETGIKGEVTHDGLAARRDSARADVHHQWLDPLLVGLPWLAAGGAGLLAVRALTRSRRGE